MSGLRFCAPDYRTLIDKLLDAGGLESCAVGYATYDALSETWLIVDTLLMPEEAYDTRSETNATLKASVLLDIAHRSRVTGHAVVLIHTHPACSGWPTFSQIDDQGENEIGPYLTRRGAKVPHLALVISPDGCRARRLGTDIAEPVWEVGGNLSLLSPLSDMPSMLQDDRQIRAFGEPGQRFLRSLHVGVIGAGGTGSLTCQQLAHLGIPKITIIDPDEVEETNLNRLVGARPSDVGVAKVDVAKRTIQQINPGCHVTAIQGDLVDEDVADLLRTFDFIMLCTDSHASRMVVNQAAYQFLVPAIDMGVSITVKADRITHITGRVQMLAPNLPCLTCTGALDAEQIRREMQSPEHRSEDPYVQGQTEPEPAVISINSTAASLAVTMMLGAVTPVPAGPRFQRYDGIRGQVRELAVQQHASCIVCSKRGALAKGASWSLPVRPADRNGGSE
ncbi:MAG: ThiF family adenylyltransferase [Alteraurantiacibacter sp. bin_em_oilr2.035]|nr:ThiF family adenylyltransferase [Alteraurantiacibacter sp. bin_em_oilr2.035]